MSCTLVKSTRTLLPLAKFHAFLKEFLTLVRAHATVWVENVERFAVAKAVAVWRTGLSLVVHALLIVVTIAVATVGAIAIR